MGTLTSPLNELQHIQALSPADPAPRGRPFAVELPGGERCHVINDLYSDRVRCDHPKTEDGHSLGAALLRMAARLGRERIVVFADQGVSEGLTARDDYSVEAVIPGYYEGARDGFVVGAWLSTARQAPRDAEALIEVDKIIEARGGARPSPLSLDPTRPARLSDAPGIAGLIEQTFDRYPRGMLARSASRAW
ncbi:hypothetical protein KKB55_07395 [Myxococcota bacterium]|nr:hypothetical protein [Myxococcota bacterium]MBU1897581.1 hypothetical protein [Myxococcota bacterium]